MTKSKKTISSFVNNQFDFILFLIIIILLSLGIVMVLSASAPSAIAESGNSYSYVKTQLLAAVIGIGLMIGISKIDYRIYKNFYKIFYVISVGILPLVLIPGLGVEANGATRWIDVGFIQFQPSEITKIGLIIFYAGYLTDHKSELKSFKNGFVRPLSWIIPPIFILYFVQNHLSASVVTAAVTCVMMIMAGCRLIYFVITGLIGALAVTVGIIALQATGKGGFRIKRIMSFMDPWADATEVGWQAVQGLYAIGSGGLFGVGLGESKQKYLYIPEPHNDFIFSIFIWRGILIAIKSPDMFGSLLATGITTLIGIQVIINIGVVTSSIPNTGMPLPFFSYGGTALLILLSSCGILLNISRAGTKV